jgi:predicted NUDIX family phosphoesterase
VTGAEVVSDPQSVRVLVVPASELDRLGRFQGFSTDVDRYLGGLLRPELLEFRPRAEVEEDPSYKQLIPYVVIRCGDAVFCYTRGKSQGEARLHAKRSLGIGGHVDESDADGRATPDAYEIALRRELDEEVAINSPGQMRCLGLINDDSTPVGEVHLGVVYEYRLEAPDVTAREDGVAEARFVSLAEVLAGRDRFETWSQICIDALLARG